jgi:hypothetical protein
MALPHIYEGTATELAPLLARNPNQRFRLIELASENGETTSELFHADASVPTIDAENAAAIALLRSWREQDATDDPEEIRKAEKELEEFKQNINANREVTGERRVYP